MKILAVDLGDVKTGLACCDAAETLAFPLNTIVEKNENKVIEKIIEKIKKLKIEIVIVGNPVNMNGSHGFRSVQCEQFAKKLKQLVQIPVVLFDERQTTMLAHRFLIESGTKKSKKKKIIDKVAATIILDDFLKFRKNQS